MPDQSSPTIPQERKKRTPRMWLFLLAVSLACGQQYVISTVAGGAPPPTPAPGTSIPIAPPKGVAADSQGNVFFSSDNCIFKLDQSGVVTRIAGTSRAAYSGDGGLAVNAQLNNPTAVALDKSGNIFVVDYFNYRIRRISPDGVIVTIAGNGQLDLTTPPLEGVPAASIGLRDTFGLATDNSGNVYYVDIYNGARVRKISTGGLVTTIAGGGSDSPGDNEIATSASLMYPEALAFDVEGNLFIADAGDARVRKIDIHGIITTIAGTGIAGFSGDGGPAVSAQVSEPSSLTVDTNGNIYIGDYGNYRVRKISSGGIISTFAGGGKAFPGDGMPATAVDFCSDYESLAGLATDASGNLFIAACWIQQVTVDGILHIVAGNGNYSFSGDGGPATNAQLYGPTNLAVDPGGNLFIVDTGNDRIRKVGTDGNITEIAGSGEVGGYGGDGGPATQAILGLPGSIALDGSGNIFFTDTKGTRIRKISPDGIITTIAGNGTYGTSPDGTMALGAAVNPVAITFDNVGNLIFTEKATIRKIGSDGTIVTLAGGATYGFSGDGGPAKQALLYNPVALAIDQNGNIFFADNSRVRMITPGGIITTVAGNGSNGSTEDTGDGGPALNASIQGPFSIAVDNVGNIFLSDLRGLRKVSNGIINTIAPNVYFIHQDSGDGGPASLASLDPGALAVDAAGRIYVIDIGLGSPTPVASSVRLLQPVDQAVLIGSVRDAASQVVDAVSPGKIVVIYGVGMGPARLIQNAATNGFFQSTVAGSQVFFDGLPAALLYASATQVAAVVPYAISAATTSVTVQYSGQTSSPYSLPVASASPGIFSSNGTGAGQVAAVNGDGSINDAAHPVKIGDYISLYVTGEGQTSPPGSDGKVAPVAAPLPKPLLPVTVQVGGISANVTYAGAAPGEIAGLMQVVVQIPASVQPGGYVPVQVSVGGNSTAAGSAWIAVSAN